MAATNAAKKAARLNRVRQARWYARQHEPIRAVFRVEIARDRLLNKLIDAGWLVESDCWRRDLVESALSLAIETLEFPRRKP